MIRCQVKIWKVGIRPTLFVFWSTTWRTLSIWFQTKIHFWDVPSSSSSS